MKRFKNILFIASPDRENESGLLKAFDLAEGNGAHLKILSVVKPYGSELSALAEWQDVMDAKDGPSLQAAAVDAMTDEVNLLADSLRPIASTLESNVLVGTPFLEIIREVLHDKHDLVVIHAEGEDGVKGRLFGTTSMHLMRKCPCPVWVIKDSQRHRFQRILVAIDSTYMEDERLAMNRKLMELAVSLTQLAAGQLHIVRAWNLPGERLLVGRGKLSPLEVKKLMFELCGSYRTWLEEFLEDFPLSQITHEIHLLKDEPEAAIVSVAESRQADLIVMGTLGRAGVSGLLIGNTAELVLRNVDCSVLAVKPDGFETPVKVEDRE